MLRPVEINKHFIYLCNHTAPPLHTRICLEIEATVIESVYTAEKAKHSEYRRILWKSRSRAIYVTIYNEICIEHRVLGIEIVSGQIPKSHTRWKAELEPIDIVKLFYYVENFNVLVVR
jgi:hypothetical protein